MRLRPACITILCLLLLCACTGGGHQQTTAAPEVAFATDSAYAYIARQVNFGARVPGSEAHQACATYLREQLRAHGADVRVEQGSLPNYMGEAQPIYNIIGSYHPEAKRRVLLCAHWDCRPWCDQEENYDDRYEPVLGANDGASGVGVLLEIARQLGQNDSLLNRVGIDIALFDAEDMGTPSFYTGKQREDTWCLGSQLWAERVRKEKRASAYDFGILLDMVGAPDAVFPKEYYSLQYAGGYVEKLWRTAAQLGYGRLFHDTRSYPLTDDHYYVNTLAGIPCVDIIHYDQQSGTGFAHYWHTRHDDMNNISKATLDAVGRTVLTMLQHEYTRNP